MKKLRTILPHVVAWVTVLFVIIIASYDPSTTEASRHLLYREKYLIWMVYFVLFYICFLYLGPKLLFRKRYLFFVVAALALYFGTFYFANYINMANAGKILRLEAEQTSISLDLRPQRIEYRVRRLDERADRAEELRHSLNVFVPESAQTAYTVFLVMTAALSLGAVNQWLKHRKMAEEAQRHQVESELIYLKQQINPHFLFNALNSIYSLVIATSNEAGDAVLKLSAILRYMLYETDKAKVPLEKEIDIIADYLALQRLKSNNKTRVMFTVEGDTSESMLPPLILIPLVENAFKYGMDNVTTSFIDIQLEAKGETLNFEISNKIACDRRDEPGGIGITNIRRRLDLIYPEKYSLTTRQEDKIFYVYLQIPIESV